MSTPLRHLLHSVLFDESTRSRLAADPEGFLSDHGWTDLAGAEIEEAVTALGDTMPVETAQAIEYGCETIDFGGDSLADIGADLAALADQVDPELPTTITSDDTDPELDLDFGTGAEPAAQSDTGADLDELSAAIDIDLEPESFAEPEWDSGAVALDDPVDVDVAESFVDDIDDLGEPGGPDGDDFGFDLEG